MKRLFVALVTFYQRFLSPLFPPACRYIPSCSEYTKEAIEKHGALKGVGMGCCRIARCHPWSKRDIYDPVP